MNLINEKGIKVNQGYIKKYENIVLKRNEKAWKQKESKELYS